MTDSMKKGEQRLAYGLLGPPILIVLSVIVFPVVWNLWLAFHRVRLLDLRRMAWWQYPATLDNFKTIFTHYDFWPALKATLLYSFGGFLIDTLVTVGWITTNETPGLSYGTVLAFGALIGMPLIAGIIGFVLGIVEAVLYNLVVRFY